MWKDPRKILPEEGTVVWVLIQHWKQQGPLSCEIYCGEVEYNDDGAGRVTNLDDIGLGAISWYFPASEYVSESPGDVIVAWALAEDLPLPC